MQDPRSKSPVLACLLSLVPGLGQIYVGYYARGFVHAIVVGLLITWAVASATNGNSGPLPLLPLFLVFFWLYNIIDAGRKAALFNQALAGGTSFELPSDFAMPSFHGSIGAGLALVGGGFVLLLHTRFGVQLDWIEDWWPLAPILFGVFLILKAMRERPATDGE